MEIYNIITLVIVLAAVFGYINERFIKLPGTIGIMVISLLASLIIVLIGKLSSQFFYKTIGAIGVLDFHTILMKIMLSFLLFAAAIRIDSNKLNAERGPILAFSTIGVVISTFVVGSLMFATTSLLNLPVNYLYCLLFGALISPTDPIAVIAILRQAKIPAFTGDKNQR